MRTLFFAASLLLVPSLVGCIATGSDSNEDTGSEADEVKVCAAGSTVKGVDVSYYQGTVDWKKAHANGIAFGIARVSDGTGFKDPKFAQNWSNMKAAGVIRGTYQFFRPGQDPIAQADLLINQIKANGGLEKGDLPPVLDVEVQDGVSDATLRARALKWLQHVEAAFGRTPIIYTAPGFWNGLGAGSEFAKYTLWVANWETSCPTMPSSWSKWKFWQKADDGSVPGISGHVDVDVFNGSLADLQAFAGGSAPPPAASLSSLDGDVLADPSLGKNADGRLEVFAVGPNRTMMTTFQVEPNGKWSDWYSLGGDIKGRIAVGTNQDSRLETFARGSDDALWHAWQEGPNGSFGKWASMNGTFTSDPVVARNGDGRLEVFGVGTNGAVYHKWQTAPNGGWSASWAKIDTAAGGGLSDPRVVKAKAGNLVLFARGADKALWMSVQANGSFGAWKSLGGGIEGAPTATKNDDGRIEVFARGTDGALWHQWEKSPGGAWSGWASLGGGVHAPFAIKNDDGTIDVFVRGDDDALYRIAQTAPNAGWGNFIKMGGSMKGAPVAGHNEDGRLEVFVRASTNSVQHTWESSPGQW